VQTKRQNLEALQGRINHARNTGHHGEAELYAALALRVRELGTPTGEGLARRIAGIDARLPIADRPGLPRLGPGGRVLTPVYEATRA
jgi:hypothetical protein